MTTRTLLALCLCAALAAAGCASSNKEPEPAWQTAVVRAPSDRVLWKLGLQALQRLGYPLGAGLDPGAMTAETGWRLDLHPFSRKGERFMAVLRMRPKERGSWTIEARVKKQENRELARPLDPRYADWHWQPDDVEQARVLLQHLRSALESGLASTPAAQAPARSVRGADER